VPDPATVTDMATQSDGGLSSTGIPYAVLNRTIVLKDSEELKGVYRGKSSLLWAYVKVKRHCKHCHLWAVSYNLTAFNDLSLCS
jgi:hypothetical protein